MSAHVAEEPIAQKIRRAFTEEQNAWRTAGGIARATGLPFEEVESFIKEHSDLFTVSEIAPAGTPLYRIRTNWPPHPLGSPYGR